ncbi:cupredoxin domain-containing protein [Actinomadura rupiterrae]|uniref:cupredoxin domain-containing protein n=1 Tax=Actinomadura rupiterrae TaxID=559627 RepID=UPI0020A392DB|nr:cupredoxin family copper-binding protein [Actinomadura rupiterrae]MCP2336812.1 plastocyanin [Actinomadura rupiterrae]
MDAASGARAAGLAAGGALILFAAVACGGGGGKAAPAASPMGGMKMPSSSAAQAPPAAGPNEVSIGGFAFGPAKLTVKRGTTVTWTNRDEDPHTVTASATGGPRSPALVAGASFRFTFTKPGTFTYICTIHPFMHGTVVVTP